MSVLKVLTEKVGPKHVLHVDMDWNVQPLFPDACPCCMEPVDPDSFITVEREGHDDVKFPSCAVCTRHTG